MAKKRTETSQGLREFIKDQTQLVFDFCSYMLPIANETSEVSLSVFREFGDIYRRKEHKGGGTWEKMEMRVKLFAIAWRHIRGVMQETPFFFNSGRDTRNSRKFDGNLLEGIRVGGSMTEDADSSLMVRLHQLDPELRAPLVLKDILRFEDEEILRVLGVRWGVYRHRLHRGRIELKDGLRGRITVAEGSGLSPTVQ